MQGYQLTFFTEQGHRHAGQPLGEWLLQAMRRLGLREGTLGTASEGFGRDGKLHAAHFVELADQPVQVTVVATAAEAAQVFALLEQEQIRLFYVQTAVDFGMTGGQP